MATHHGDEIWCDCLLWVGSWKYVSRINQLINQSINHKTEDDHICWGHPQKRWCNNVKSIVLFIWVLFLNIQSCHCLTQRECTQNIFIPKTIFVTSRFLFNEIHPTPPPPSPSFKVLEKTPFTHLFQPYFYFSWNLSKTVECSAVPMFFAHPGNLRQQSLC